MTHWTPSQRADAIGRALAIGADKAHEQTGIPRRTISSWLSRERPAPELDALIVTSRESLAETLQAGAAEGAAALLVIVRSPTAADRDKVRAAEVLLERWQLASGGPTAINANVNVNADFPLTGDMSDEERDQARDLIREAIRQRMAADESDAASTALEALPDPTAALTKESILSLINVIERRLGNEG